MHWKVLVIALAVAAPLLAQQPGKPDTMAGGMMGPGQTMGGMMSGSMMEHMGPAMMRMMLYTPQHLLARKDALALSADQVSRLTTLRDGTKAAHDAAEADAETHVRAMEQVANAAQPDSVALKTHFQAAHAAMGKAHWAMLASATQARAILSEAQRTKVQQWADSMQAWMQQHRQMMNPAHRN